MPRNLEMRESIEMELERGNGIFQMMDRVRNSIICYAMHRCDNNISEAARLLQVSRPQMSMWVSDLRREQG